MKLLSSFLLAFLMVGAGVSVVVGSIYLGSVVCGNELGACNIIVCVMVVGTTWVTIVLQLLRS